MDTTTTCYRHPGREAPLRCTRCERPICLDDAIDAPVGYLCPDDARQSARVRRATSGASATVTKVLVGLLVAVFAAQELAPFPLAQRGVTFGPLIAAGEWWRVLTGAFLHANLFHIGFNGYLLYQLGLMIEPTIGRGRFLGLYVAGLGGGALGVLVLSWDAPTLGASGAVFGLMGAAMVLLRRRGINPWQTSIGSLVVLNLVVTFAVPNISIGGHLGGLLGGAVAALAIGAGTDRGNAATAVPWVVAAVLLGAAFVVGVTGPVLPSVAFLS